MIQSDTPENKWDSLQVDVTAEFEKVKVSLGEIKQITEGLVLDIAPIADNEIHLYAGDEAIAIGELIIIDDKFAVKINKVFNDPQKTKLVKPVDEYNFDEEELYHSQRKRHHDEDDNRDQGKKQKNKRPAKKDNYQENENDEAWGEEPQGMSEQGQEIMTVEHAQHIVGQLVQQGMPPEQAQPILDNLLQQGVTLDQAYHSINQMLQPAPTDSQAPLAQQQGAPQKQGQGNQEDFDYSDFEIEDDV